MENKIQDRIDNLDKIRLDLKKKALLCGDTTCALLEYELGQEIKELRLIANKIEQDDNTRSK